MRARTRCFRLLPVSCATCRGIAELPRVPEPTRQRPHSSSCVLQPSAETSVSIASPSLCRSFPYKVCPSRLSQFKGSLHFLCDQADGRQAQSPVSNFALDAQFSLGRRLTWADVHSRARLIATAPKTGTITLTNSGTLAFTLNGAPTITKTAGPGTFSIVTGTGGGTCTSGSTIAAGGGSCTIVVQYTTSSATTSTANVTVAGGVGAGGSNVSSANFNAN